MMTKIKLERGGGYKTCLLRKGYGYETQVTVKAFLPYVTSLKRFGHHVIVESL